MWALIWSGLATFFYNIIPQLGAKLLIALGISVFTFPALDFLLTTCKNYFYSSLSGLPADAIAIMGLLRVGDAIEIVFAAYTFRYALFKLTPSKLSIS